ncbi:MAG: hypothetical protein GF317_20625 [Candidatus Lokiarchaeota archaeon]|nr:hypothetical protein [Candidatus Lokiarchaeota archaeon]MBD3201870.1 hypothetical protein [Candidatus Lokiarchaeota archaeon]
MLTHHQISEEIPQISEEIVFSQRIRIVKKYTNEEIKYYQYFYTKTGFYPENLIIVKDILFYFVNLEDYFSLTKKLPKMRGEIKNKKIIFIRNETKMIKLLFSFFPDTYIHDIETEIDISTKEVEFVIYFLSYKDRGIAVGRSGEYIVAVNEILNNYLSFENSQIPIKVSCHLL